MRNDNQTVLTAKANTQTISDILKAIETARPIFEKFNGKVVNKRIKDELNENTGCSWSFREDAYSADFDIYAYQNRHTTGEPDKNGCSLAYYATIDRATAYNHDKENLPIVEGRLNAPRAIELLDAMSEDYTERLKEEKKIVRYYDSLMKKLEKANEQAKKARRMYEELPYTFRNFNRLRDF